KVLGASLRSIFNLLTVNFLRLVLVAFVLAIPIAWYIMNDWLNGFEYRIEISWPIFVLAGLAAFLIALGTISVEAGKAATANPASRLRSE
ncbi:MAG: FtsX-like permease family protein, partial [Bacteroidota bacterium]